MCCFSRKILTETAILERGWTISHPLDPMKHYINLTNGLEYLIYGIKPDGFIRIQSTACEQKRWWDIILDLDYTFLLDITQNPVIIYDASAHKNVPRAIFQGLEWIKYVLHRRWLKQSYTPIVRGHNCSEYFDWVYQVDCKERKKALKKLDYINKITSPKFIKIEAISHQTKNDGDYIFFRQIIKKTNTTVSPFTEQF
jgi:hypothetical protein